LNNQAVIALIGAINNQNKFSGSKKQQRQIINIKQSGLIVNLINLSDKKFAPKHNNVGLARDCAAREICLRFQSAKLGDRGVIAMTDCDCRFSSNYIFELIRTFGNPEVNAVAGNWITEIDKSVPYRKFVRQAVAIHLKNETSRPRSLPSRRLPLKNSVITNGQNLAVSCAAFTAVGGVPHFGSMEDLVFGQKLRGLPGKAIFNPNFFIVGNIRMSERAGMTSFGRRVKSIVESIESFSNGQANKIYILDHAKVVSLFKQVIDYLRRGELDESILKSLLQSSGANISDLAASDIRQLVRVLIK
jgi:hypothetical protein